MHWGIVGGGLLGMTLAHRLSQRGEKVTLLESGAELGGLAAAWSVGDLVWDRHYHVILLSDSHLRGLLAEIGLDALRVGDGQGQGAQVLDGARVHVAHARGIDGGAHVAKSRSTT